MDSDMEESARRKSMKRRFVVPGDSTAHKQSDHVKTRPYSVSGEVKFIQEEDTRLETTRERLNNVLKRHEDLQKRLIRDSDKMIYERLTKEFEAARAAQTEEIKLDDEQWNDGLLATIREKKFIDYVGAILQGFVDRREQQGDHQPKIRGSCLDPTISNQSFGMACSSLQENLSDRCVGNWVDPCPVNSLSSSIRRGSFENAMFTGSIHGDSAEPTADTPTNVPTPEG
ncbi:hypothetical protein QJS10_CPB18g00166 [Acorus calamus]|uniref:Uncharacterized protein n=1 Tax=Acorus calamus TaxID=4465 RepID=A0AAV9CN02_ACOCL|nr:hypothetical protein QJS10_CPB18g00166 [Acorus calamus]